MYNLLHIIIKPQPIVETILRVTPSHWVSVHVGLFLRLEREYSVSSKFKFSVHINHNTQATSQQTSVKVGCISDVSLTVVSRSIGSRVVHGKVDVLVLVSDKILVQTGGLRQM